MKQGNTCKFIPLDKDITSILLPLFTGIKAGFPSPANDFIDPQIDLTKLLIPRPSSTFLMRVSGDSMVNAGIKDNAIIVVDKSIKLTDNRIFVCYLDGEFTVKRVKRENGKCVLHSENPNYKPIVPDDESNFLLWGAVTYAINQTT
jgi:DNA polymerase V